MQTPRKRATQTPSPPSIKRTDSGLLATRFDADVQSSVWHSLTGFEGGKDAKEMPRSYKGLVDTCFEEGHYESGIQVLDRLRSPRHIPTISHVRQLIYMALYPPPPPPSPVTGQNAYESPRKAHAKRQRRFLVPSADASIGATALLTAFMHTNHPYSVFRAIPSYGTPSTGKKGIKFKDVADNDETINREMEDSPIGRDARVLGQVKDCWGLLEPGLVKSKDRREAEESGSDGDRESDELNLGNNSKVASRVVGKHSWGMLEVLIEGFEEDERRSKETKDGTPDLASQILLTQVPHAQHGQPWNVERPINVIFASLSSSTLTPLGSPKANQGISIDPYRAQLGIRLLKLLINAALATPSINPSSLLRFSLAHIQKTSFPPESLQLLLDNLMQGDSYLHFVIALLGQFLGREVEENANETLGTRRWRPAPSTKPRPRASQIPNPSRASTSARSSLRTSPSSGPNLPFPLPPLHTFLLHLSSLISVPFAARIPAVDIVDIKKAIIAKMYLLFAFDRICAAPALLGVGSSAEEKAQEWRAALHQGVVLRSLKSCFEPHAQKLKRLGTQIPALIDSLYDLVGDMAHGADASRPDAEMVVG